jgi:hypothetical protein
MGLLLCRTMCVPTLQLSPVLFSSAGRSKHGCLDRKEALEHQSRGHARVCASLKTEPTIPTSNIAIRNGR